MSIATEFYIAPSEKTACHGFDRHKPDERWQYSNITPLELSTLWAILRDEEWHFDSMNRFESVHSAGENKESDEGFTHKVPEELTLLLSSISNPQLGNIASKWAATEELRWPTEDAQNVIEDLIKISKRALESGQCVFIWNCF